MRAKSTILAVGASNPLSPRRLLLALLLAFARVYVGVHYPSDVAGGLAIGAAIGTLVVLTLRPATAAVALRLARTPLRPLIVSRN